MTEKEKEEKRGTDPAAAAAIITKDPVEGYPPLGGPSAFNLGSAGDTPRKPHLPPPPAIPKPVRRPAWWTDGLRPNNPFFSLPCEVPRTEQGHFPHFSPPFSSFPPLLGSETGFPEIPNPDLQINK